MPEAMLDQVSPEFSDIESGAGFGPVDDEIDNGPGVTEDFGEQPEEPDVAETETEEVPEEKPRTGQAKTREELAEEHGLDINNPAHRKLLDKLMAQDKRIADKDKYINELRAGGKETEEMFSELDSLLDEPDEPVAQPKNPEKPVQQPKPAEQPAAKQGGDPFGDGLNWQSPNDAYRDLGTEWARINADIEAGRQADYSNLNRLENSLFARRMAGNMGMVAQIVQRYLEDFKQNELAPIVPQINDVVESRRVDMARQEVQAAIAKSKGGELFREMMTPEGKGYVTVDGERFPDAPFYRIVSEHPGIMKIQERTPDGKIDHKRTMHAQYVEVMRIYHRDRQRPTEAKKLVAAGQKIQQEKQTEQARQRINASGANRSAGAAGGGKSTPRAMSVSDFFK